MTISEEELNRLLKANRDAHYAYRGPRYLIAIVLFFCIALVCGVMWVSFRINYIPGLHS